jgi:long-chain acyl-CoA synthetase
VELTHGNLLSDLEALLAVRRAAPGDALISIMSPSELFELTVGLLAALACGARVVYAGPLPPNRLLRAMREEHISHALLVPAFLQLLIEEVLDELADAGLLDRQGTLPELARRLRDEPDPELRGRWRAAIRGLIGERLRHIAVGGAALDPVWAELAAELGLAVDLGYGMAEAGPVVCLGPVDAARRGSVGRPLPGIEVRVSPGGEILVRGPNVMRGYRGDPEATAAALANGWLHTGDRGHVDAAGCVFIEGRIKETMVTSSGQTVHPEEIEPFYASTLFREYCVAPLRDAAGNDSPTLFLVPLSPEVSASEIDDTFKTLRAAAPPRARVETWVALEDPLPRTPLGKIRRRYLADLWQDRKATHDE